MALSLEISTSEMLRVAQAAYEGRKLEVFLANDLTNALSVESTYADWKLKELPAENGYAAYESTISSGAYDFSDVRHEIGPTTDLNSTFPAIFSGAPDTTGYSYNCVVAAIHEPDGLGGWTAPVKIYGIYRTFPVESVFPGQEVQYPIFLVLAP
jgi:hypothetical protein